MRSALLLVVALVPALAGAACSRPQRDAARRPPPPATHPAPAHARAPTSAAPAAPPCPPEWPRPDHPEPVRLAEGAVVACAEGRRFEGAAVEALRRALGTDFGEARPVKCQGGYPIVTLLTATGERLDLLFCAQYGAEQAHSSGHRLHVRDPAAVDAWLRSAGFSIPAHDYR